MKRQLHNLATLFVVLLATATARAQGIFNLYGLAAGGGPTSAGAIFKTASDGTNAMALAYFTTGTTGTGYNPQGSLVAYNGKLYGLTYGSFPSGGSSVFSIDPTAAMPAITKLADFTTGTTGTGINPFGSLVVYNSKLYGLTAFGGANGGGTVFSIDPAAATPAITKLADFTTGTTGTGINPFGSLVVYNSKLYGLTMDGGAGSGGTVFSIDPTAVTPAITKLADFITGTTGTGYQPFGSLVVYNGKLYGLTFAGGASNVGTVFYIDPAVTTPAITKLADFTTGTGTQPTGSLIVYNSKLYGLTFSGGAGSGGTVFSIDPTAATPAITKLADFTTATGITPHGSLVLYNSKLYGLTMDGGAYSKGIVFSIDPAAATPAITKTADLSSTTGANPNFGSLLPYAARTAPGTIGTCESETSVTGTGSTPIGITNSTSDAVAEINPNGNSMGSVSTALYTMSTTGTIREDANNKTFLDRNVTITPTTQPTTNVDVRIYITEAEYQHLKTSSNSLSSPSGISGPADIQLYKSSSACSATGAIPSSMTALTTTIARWDGGGYVLSTSVSSFLRFISARAPLLH